ncbi:2954_t:CDS:2 [Entrophospora sp. SA101]|nr:2954_t:CDS:2 [Entrophospora sp. SA101]
MLNVSDQKLNFLKGLKLFIDKITKVIRKNENDNTYDPNNISQIQTGALQIYNRAR